MVSFVLDLLAPTPSHLENNTALAILPIPIFQLSVPHMKTKRTSVQKKRSSVNKLPGFENGASTRIGKPPNARTSASARRFVRRAD
jgi:hypothetical protein